MVEVAELEEPPWADDPPWRIDEPHDWGVEPTEYADPPWAVEGGVQRETDDGGLLKATYVINNSYSEDMSYRPGYCPISLLHFWFETPDRDEITFFEDQTDEYPDVVTRWFYPIGVWDLLRKGHRWIELWNQTGGTRPTDNADLIPTNVATLGKPAIAVYLNVVHDASKSEIASQLDVTVETARKYLTRFDRGSSVLG